MTCQAAYCYSLQLSELDDCLDDLSESQGLIDCVVLAHKFFEKDLWDLNSIENLDSIQSEDPILEGIILKSLFSYGGIVYPAVKPIQ